MRPSSLALMVLLSLALLPRAAEAQGPPTLSEVERLIGEGRILQARELLEGWWEEQGPNVDRADRQRSLWLRARLTVDPSMAELDLRRLVLEFPGGSFSDDALLRLAQAAELRGARTQARDHYSALVRGYPSSPHASWATAWLAGEVPEMGPPPERPQAGTGEASDPILSGDQGSISVQLGAFRSLDGARSLEEDLRAAGFEPRVVRINGTGLFRVRVGRFRTREELVGLRRRLMRAGFESTVATDAEAEERIG